MSTLQNPQEQTNTALDEVREVAIGTIDGSNKVFTSSVDFEASTLKVFLNGQLVELGADREYTITDTNEVTMTDSPKIELGSGDVITLIYIPA